MRPERLDIAMPPFPPDAEWIGERLPGAERLAAVAPVLIHFFDFAQLNSMRALPYVLDWRKRYAEHGLRVVGAHASRFPPTADPDAIAAASGRLGIEHPVVIDSRLSMWRDYGCRGWPSLFLFSKGGALRWYHPGEGEYAATEEAIQEALDEAGLSAEWPPPLEPLRPSDAPGAQVAVPTAEIFPGGSPTERWQPRGSEAAIEADYAAGSAHAVVDGRGSVVVEIDGEERGEVAIDHPGLLTLAEHPRHEQHSLRLLVRGEVAIYALSFAPGVP